MKEAIKNIIRKWGCCHEWVLRDRFEMLNDKQVTKGYKFLYICKRCGKMRLVKVLAEL